MGKEGKLPSHCRQRFSHNPHTILMSSRFPGDQTGLAFSLKTELNFQSESETTKATHCLLGFKDSFLPRYWASDVPSAHGPLHGDW